MAYLAKESAAFPERLADMIAGRDFAAGIEAIVKVAEESIHSGMGP